MLTLFLLLKIRRYVKLVQNKGDSMNFFKKLYCRVYQFIFKLAMPLLPYKEPKILDSVLQISSELKKQNMDRVLLVTGPNLRAKKITEPLEKDLEQNGIKCFVYDKTEQNPTVENILDASCIYLQNDCQAIIGFGGGSNIDCAKGVGAKIACPKKEIYKLKGLMKVNKKTPLLIAIPTTAGSGSEATLTAVITDKQKGQKYTINSFTLIPSFAVLDSALLKSLPKSLIATTGMDALTHSVEAYIGKATTKKTREWATQSIKLIFENLPLAYSQEYNEIAMQNMLKASYLAGLAFSRSYVGYVHALSHSLSAKYNYAHGQTNAIILPYVLKNYGKKAVKSLYRLGKTINIHSDKDKMQVANAFIQKIEVLNKSMQIPNKIEFDINDLEFLSSHASLEANPLYPVPKLFDKTELAKIYLQIKA